MTDQFNKLADALDAIADSRRGDFHKHERDSCREAAALLRAAAGVDVAGLIELAAKAIYGQWADQLGWVEWVPGGNSMNQDEARRIARTALESSLRLVLAQRVPPSNPIGYVVLDHYSPGNHLFASFSATRNTEHDWKPVHLNSEKS